MACKNLCQLTPNVLFLNRCSKKPRGNRVTQVNLENRRQNSACVENTHEVNNMQ